MPAIESLLSQFNKREQAENKGGDDSNDRSPVVIAGLIIAALTLLLAIMSYQHSRFSHPVLSFLLSALSKYSYSFSFSCPY